MFCYLCGQGQHVLGSCNSWNILTSDLKLRCVKSDEAENCNDNIVYRLVGDRSEFLAKWLEALTNCKEGSQTIKNITKTILKHFTIAEMREHIKCASDNNIKDNLKQITKTKMQSKLKNMSKLKNRSGTRSVSNGEIQKCAGNANYDTSNNNSESFVVSSVETSCAKECEKTYKQDGQTCSICCHECNEPNNICVLGCGHKFHMSCMMPWIIKNKEGTTCPLCRASIMKSANDEQTEKYHENTVRNNENSTRRVSQSEPPFTPRYYTMSMEASVPPPRPILNRYNSVDGFSNFHREMIEIVNYPQEDILVYDSENEQYGLTN